MLSVFAAAFGLGLVFNAAPGPVFAATLRHGVRGGFRPALAVQLGSLVGDALWAVLGLAGVGLLATLESLRIPIGIAGALYLLWLARDAWVASWLEFTIDGADESGSSDAAIKSGMLLSLTNPQNIGYWAALGSALGAVGVHATERRLRRVLLRFHAVIGRLGDRFRCHRGLGARPRGQPLGARHVSHVCHPVPGARAHVTARVVDVAREIAWPRSDCGSRRALRWR